MSWGAHALVVAALLSVGVLPNLRAQAPSTASLGAAVRARIEENQRALRQYTWKQRTELQLKGQVKNERVELVQFDADGELQRTPLGSSPAPVERRGVRGHIRREKQEETQAYLQRMIERAVRYLYPSPASLSAPFEKAEVWEGKGATSGTVQVRVKDFVIQGDSMTFYVDVASHKPRRLEVTSSLDDDPISITTEYGDLPDGPTYGARTTVHAVKKQIQIKIENFDFARLTKTK
ncbi:MAG TPA: hypothetical protein VKE24_15785 [Candidatus Acidoferrales bacterium]|nr:hypothetical protein [Candidatus Acidoferrales bacterium]